MSLKHPIRLLLDERPEQAYAKLVEAYAEADWNLLTLAENLEVSRTTVHKWLKEYPEAKKRMNLAKLDAAMRGVY